MESSKKVLLSVIGIAILLVLVSGITFAFFNYTRTGTANIIRVGRISFVTNQTDTISLTNLFPIDPAETGIMDDDEKVGTLEITIEGDTDYSSGIEYLVSSVDSEIYTSTGKNVPISLNITVDDLGTESTNYFTARENTNESIYKKLVGDTLVGDGMLLVGFIAPNSTPGTADGIDGSITIKAYLDKNKILISDTYDGTESDNMGTTNSKAADKTVITTSEWNDLQNSGISFKVKVEANEGIWVIGSVEEIMKTKNYSETLNRGIRDDESSTFVTSNSGIDFGAISSDTNGKGVYMRAGTQNDEYPILYYRGAIEDNNVLFGNQCWKTVRTTDTGGVKLIYNGEAKHIYIDDNYDLSAYIDVIRTGNQFEFDPITNEWKVTLTIPSTGGGSGEANIKFKVAEAGNYTLKFNNPGSGPVTATRAGTSLNPTTGVNEIALNNLTTSEEINFAITWYNAANASVEIKLALYKGRQIDFGVGCDNEGEETQITLNIGGTDTNTFKFSTTSGDYDSPAYNGYMYGDVYVSNSGVVSGAYYDSTFVWNGTNYTLTDTATTTKSNNAHYSCGETTKTASCSSLRYYYYGNDYIILTGGDGVEEALIKMQTNTNDSNAKDKIEDWYGTNMTTYTNRIEDTIYCNDRSMNNTNGWNANGGNLSEYLVYGGFLRESDSETVTPSLSCSNKNDSFTWKNSNGNRKLQYPVGMITSDELILAGGTRMSANLSFYLMTGQDYWSMSPLGFHSSNTDEYTVISAGYIGYNTRVDNSYGLRPIISLKPGIPVVGGTGTVLDPYVIE